MSADGPPGRANILLHAATHLAWTAGRALPLAAVLACAWAGLRPAVAEGDAVWPAGWEVIRVDLPPSGGSGTVAVVPACMLTTSDHAARPSNPTRWALRYRKDELVVIENSMSVGDATIPGLALGVDGRGFGTFPIRERVSTPEHTPSVVKYVSAIAPVPDAAVRESIVAALRAGSLIQIERRGRAFEAVLDGRSAAAFESCRRALDR